MSVITNNTLLDMDSIKIDNNYDMVYKNDLSEITITILENSYISIQNLKRIVNLDNKFTFSEYLSIVKNYLEVITSHVLQKVPFDWNTFKNYLNCELECEGLRLRISANVLPEYKPDDNFTYSLDKLLSINNSKQPNLEMIYTPKNSQKIKLGMSGNLLQNLKE